MNEANPACGKRPIVRDADGCVLVCEADWSGGRSLADWLADCGHPLNTRCGGRGLCHGCEVLVAADENGRLATIKACQTPVDALPGIVVNIPRGSLHDRSITGVSVFDIAAPGMATESALPDGCAGVSLDIGTTTLAVAVWAGSPLKCLGTASAPNPQARFGDNVVSRIQFSLDHPDGDLRLHRILLDEGIGPLIRSTCRAVGLDPGRICKAAAAGNPAMLHTLAGEPLEGLATFPFRPRFLDERRMRGGIPGLRGDVELLLLGSLGPFVGADIAAGALACGLLDAPAPSLLIDFGTNGEILLKTRDGFLATATAAGPAFEGGRLACGAMAGKGVISGINGWNAATGKWEVRGVNARQERFHGIAGAAYVDFLAVAVEAGMVNGSGRLQAGHAAVEEAEDGDGWGRRRIVLADEAYVTEADIAELIQAKAAIQAGWATLLDEADVGVGDLQMVFIAGGFGYHLTPRCAAAIGLLPDVEPHKFRLVGNSSLGGASLALLGGASSERISALREEVRLVELNKTKSFEDHYIDAMVLCAVQQ